MNRSFVLNAVGVFLIAIQALLSCSSPLEGISDLDTSPPDMTVSTDFCAKLGDSRDEVEWHIDNSAGRFILEFVALSESGVPPKLFELEIGRQKFKWYPNRNLEFSVELDLKSNTEVEVEIKGHKSSGDVTEICLTVTEK